MHIHQTITTLKHLSGKGYIGQLAIYLLWYLYAEFIAFLLLLLD